MTPATSDQPLLQVDGLTVTYGHSGPPWRRVKPYAVEDVTFDILPGETLGLVGESGSGKSTTGRAILRLTPTERGAIRFAGEDITQWGAQTPLSYRRDVQAVFQDPSSSLNPRHAVSRSLESTLRRHGVRDADEVHRRTVEAFEQVGLTQAHMSRFPNEMSGGQQQRVAIARALVLRPKLVICDEAVSALDLSTQSQIINLLKDLQQATGVSYLFIAHDLGIVRHISDRIGVMQKGRLVELAAADELFAHARDPYTRRLLGASPASHPDGREERRTRRAMFREAHARHLLADDEPVVEASAPTADDRDPHTVSSS